MPRDTRALLADALDAARSIEDFRRDLDLDGFRADDRTSPHASRTSGASSDPAMSSPIATTSWMKRSCGTRSRSTCQSPPRGSKRHPLVEWSQRRHEGSSAPLLRLGRPIRSRTMPRPRPRSAMRKVRELLRLGEGRVAARPPSRRASPMAPLPTISPGRGGPASPDPCGRGSMTGSSRRASSCRRRPGTGIVVPTARPASGP